MCETRPADFTDRGRLRFASRSSGDLVLAVDRETKIRADPTMVGTDGLAASAFDFFCEHGDGVWEPLELPPPRGLMVVVPAGSTIRAVPRDPDLVLPEPDPPGIRLLM